MAVMTPAFAVSLVAKSPLVRSYENSRPARLDVNRTTHIPASGKLQIVPAVLASVRLTPILLPVPDQVHVKAKDRDIRLKTENCRGICRW